MADRYTPCNCDACLNYLLRRTGHRRGIKGATVGALVGVVGGALALLAMGVWVGPWTCLLLPVAYTQFALGMFDWRRRESVVLEVSLLALTGETTAMQQARARELFDEHLRIEPRYGALQPIEYRKWCKRWAVLFEVQMCLFKARDSERALDLDAGSVEA